MTAAAACSRPVTGCFSQGGEGICIWILRRHGSLLMANSGWKTLLWQKLPHITQRSRTPPASLSSLSSSLRVKFTWVLMLLPKFPSSLPIISHRHNKMLAPFMSSWGWLLGGPGLMQNLCIRTQRPRGTDGR